MTTNDSSLLLALIPILVGGCLSDKSPHDVPCDVVSTEQLSSVDESEWPAGLSSALAAYDAMDGTWTATLSCNDGGSPTEVSVGIEVADHEDVEVQGFDGPGCEPGDLDVAVTQTLVTITGWSEGSVNAVFDTAFRGDEDVLTVWIEGGVDPMVTITSASGSLAGSLTSIRVTEAEGRTDHDTVECTLEDWVPV